MLSGSGFTPASKVKISGTPATTTTYISSNYLTATQPAGTVTGNVTVTTAPSTSAITSASFTYDPSKNIARGKTAASPPPTPTPEPRQAAQRRPSQSTATPTVTSPIPLLRRESPPSGGEGVRS
ncbi:IPT/TIG domain-containing protein [Streptomyces sp. NPDC057565]|uniref:IPT/TIG domain-containing protein n=1 Tax=Streptomyces sp. NPDC057565 TaxID=3346169 RepID=UPI0036B436D8